jgi:hypothetical protein
MQDCIQLLLAFGDDGTDALILPDDQLRNVGIGEYGVRGIKVWNLDIVNMTRHIRHT